MPLIHERDLVISAFLHERVHSLRAAWLNAAPANRTFYFSADHLVYKCTMLETDTSKRFVSFSQRIPTYADNRVRRDPIRLRGRISNVTQEFQHTMRILYR